MTVLEELGVDAIGPVRLPEKDWQVIALKMIEDRRKQVTAAFRRARTERHNEALTAELKRMADLETYVRVCQNGLTEPRGEGA